MNLNKQLSVFFLSLIFLFIFALPASAQLVDELKGKISDKTSEITKIEQEIAKYQKELNVLGGKSDTLKNSISKLNTTRKKLQADIRYTQFRIDSSTDKIKKLEVAAMRFGVSHFVKCKRGAKKIPPPIPTNPEIKPINPPNEASLTRLGFLKFSFSDLSMYFESHIVIAATVKVMPNRI